MSKSSILTFCSKANALLIAFGIIFQAVALPLAQAQGPVPEIDQKEVQFDIINILKNNRFSPDYAKSTHGHVVELKGLVDKGESTEIKDTAAMVYLEIAHLHQYPDAAKDAKDILTKRFNICENPFECARKIDLLSETTHLYPNLLLDSENNPGFLNKIRQSILKGFGKEVGKMPQDITLENVVRDPTILEMILPQWITGWDGGIDKKHLWKVILFYKIESVRLYAELMARFKAGSPEYAGTLPRMSVKEMTRFQERAEELALFYENRILGMRAGTLAKTIAGQLALAASDPGEKDPDIESDVFVPLAELFLDGLGQYDLGNKTVYAYAFRPETLGLDQFKGYLNRYLDLKSIGPTEVMNVFLRFFQIEKHLETAPEWVKLAGEYNARFKKELRKNVSPLNAKATDRVKLGDDLKAQMPLLTPKNSDKEDPLKLPDLPVDEPKVPVVPEKKEDKPVEDGLEKAVREMGLIVTALRAEDEATAEAFKVPYKETLFKKGVAVATQFPDYQSLHHQIMKLKRAKEKLMGVKDTIKNMEKPTEEEIALLKEEVKVFQTPWIALGCYGYLNSIPKRENYDLKDQEFQESTKDMIDSGEHKYFDACMGGGQGLAAGFRVMRQMERGTLSSEANAHTYITKRAIKNEWIPVLAMGVTLVAMAPIVFASSGLAAGAAGRVAMWVGTRVAVDTAVKLTVRQIAIIGVSYYATNIIVFEITRRTLMFALKNTIKFTFGQINNWNEIDYTDWYDPKKNWFENWGKDILLAGTAFYFLNHVGALAHARSVKLFEYMAKNHYRIVKSAFFRDLVEFSMTTTAQAAIVFPMAVTAKQLEHFFRRKKDDPFFHTITTKELEKDFLGFAYIICGLYMIQRRFAVQPVVSSKEPVAFDFITSGLIPPKHLRGKDEPAPKLESNPSIMDPKYNPWNPGRQDQNNPNGPVPGQKFPIPPQYKVPNKVDPKDPPKDPGHGMPTR